MNETPNLMPEISQIRLIKHYLTQDDLDNAFKFVDQRFDIPAIRNIALFASTVNLRALGLLMGDDSILSPITKPTDLDSCRIGLFNALVQSLGDRIEITGVSND